MNDHRDRVSEADLHAFVDGQLARPAADAVAAYLAHHPDEALRVESYRRINQALRDRFDPLLAESIPQPLRAAAIGGPLPRRWRVAAALGWLALGALLGWQARPLPEPESQTAAIASRLATPALAAHAVYTPEVRHAVEVGADQEAHLIAWLSKRLGAPVRAPALGAIGYRLVGGRLLPSDDGPAAQFMYENASGRRVTLYVRTSVWDNRETAFRYTERNGIGAFYWVDGPLGYTLSGAAPRAELIDVAHAVYDDLNP